jgi:hypothetical protein
MEGVISSQLVRKPVDSRQRDFRAIKLRGRDRPVQCDDWRRVEPTSWSSSATTCDQSVSLTPRAHQGSQGSRGARPSADRAPTRTPTLGFMARQESRARAPAAVPEDVVERVRALCFTLPEVTVRIDESRTTTRSTAHSFDIRRKSFCLLVATRDPTG